MAKKNMTITLEGMTSTRSHAYILEMLNTLNDSDRFACESVALGCGIYYPLFNTTVKTITVEETAKGYNVDIALHSGVTLYGKAVHLERMTMQFSDFTIYEVELPRF